MVPRIWLAADLEKMSPAEIDAIFEASILSDLEDAPQELLNRARERALERIERTEGKQRP